MELKAFLHVIFRRKWTIFALFAILVIVVLIAAQMIPQKYEAVARLRVQTPKMGGTNYLDFNNYYATRLMNTYASLASSASIQEELRQKLLLVDKPDIETTVIVDSELIVITVQDRSAETSAAVANTLADILISRSGQVVTETKSVAEIALKARLQELDVELIAARKIYNDLLVPYTQNNSRITVLTNQIGYDHQLYSLLRDRYEQNLVIVGISPATQAALEKQIEDITTKIEQEENELNTLNAKAAQDAPLVASAQGEVSIREQAYTTLRMQLDEILTIQAIQGANVLTVVDRAEPSPIPASPNYLFIYALGVAVSLFLAVLLAFLVNSLDDTLDTTAKIEALIPFPMLGRIPQVSGAAQEALYPEEINRLRLTLQRVAHQTSFKSLAITSADPGHDAAAVCINLARAYARSGVKTLLVDTNPKASALQQTFSSPEGEEAANHTIMASGEANLWLRPAVPGEEFLGIEKLQGLMTQFQKKHALVIINLPPILSVSIADEWAALADQMILVVERGQAREQDVQGVLKHLANLNTPLLGFVINQAEVNRRVRAYQKKSRLQKSRGKFVVPGLEKLETLFSATLAKIRRIKSNPEEH